MLSPEDNQVGICLLKSNLEEIKNDVIAQNAALPKLDAEREQKSRNVQKNLQVVRAFAAESAQLHEENMRLVTKRKQYQRQNEDNKNALEKTLEAFAEMETEMEQGDQDIEKLVFKYEESLHEIAGRLRKASIYYNDESVNAEIAEVETKMNGLKTKMDEREAFVEGLRRELDGLQAAVPKDLLTTVYKAELDEKVQSITTRCEALHQKRNQLLEKRSLSFGTKN